MDYTQEYHRYLNYCEKQKRLDEKTIKAYRIDIRQFLDYIGNTHNEFSRECIDEYLAQINLRYKPRSVKRKIASLKGFCSYLEAGTLFKNPFSGMRLKIVQKKTLPRIIPLRVIDSILIRAHEQVKRAEAGSANVLALKEAAVLELLFATGIRVSELCSIENRDINLQEGYLLIHGKGNKERIIDIENREVLHALEKYKNAESNESEYFFLNRQHRKLSDQSVRLIVNKYAALVCAEQHITPHIHGITMFNSFPRSASVTAISV